MRLLLDEEPGLQVIAESAMIDATFRAIRARRPDVLVLDLNMPGGSSLEAIPRLVAPSPRTAIVALTMEDDPVLAREAARAGARGFVLKDAAKNDLVQAIGTAGPGGR